MGKELRYYYVWEERSITRGEHTIYDRAVPGTGTAMPHKKIATCWSQDHAQLIVSSLNHA